MPTFFLTPDGKRLNGVAYVFLVLLCLAFYAPGFATLPPTDRDESSFAQATKQMIETGNYVDIRLQDVPRYKKPIGIYWLQAASVRILNPTHLNEIWAYRVPSFVGATVSVLMTAALGTLLFGPMAGFIAALMLAGCVLLNVEARLAKTDAMLLATIMVMQYALARAYIKREGGIGLFLAFWTAIGAGLLIKGPIIFLVLAATLVWLWRTEKNLAWFSSLKPLLGVPYALLLTAPWFIAIMMQSHGAFIQQSAGNDLLAKLWQGQNRGILPPGFYLTIFPATFFPFSLFALLAIPDAWKKRRDPAVRFCLGWIVLTWIVFELPLTKLLHYVLPTYPAIAMLAAKALVDGFPALADTRRWISGAAAGLWLVLGMGFAIAFATLPVITNGSADIPKAVSGVVLIAAQGIGLFLLVQKKPLAGVATIATGFLIFTAMVFNSTLPGLQHIWLSRDAVAMAQDKSSCPHPHIISASYGEPSLVFLAGTDTEIVKDGAEAARDLQKDKCNIALIDNKHADDFLNALLPRKPLMAGQIEGLNAGRGKKTELTLYLPGMP
jgi:4-amino-4-deoxy-L-arabinose transferase-like glycosyltransferase